ncbi:phosphoribosylamine--glycine ligase, partial [mine drainage metagenome]
MRVLIVGGGAREHAIADALHRSGAELYVASSNANPGLERLAHQSARLEPTDPAAVVAWATRHRAELAVLGPEAPLAAGVSDALRAAEIPTVGPSKAAAEIEWSKRFCRELLERHHLGPQPRFRVLTKIEEVDAALAAFPPPFVIKPSGLTAGKGVRVQGVDFGTVAEG